MSEDDWLVERFEEQRPHLRGVAYRMLGSLSEADDAVQETWQRVSRSDTSDVENLGGWLTTITSRVCLNVLGRAGHDARNHSRHTCRTRSWIAPTSATPSTRPCWPTPSASRCSSCSRP